MPSSKGGVASSFPSSQILCFGLGLACSETRMASCSLDGRAHAVVLSVERSSVTVSGPKLRSRASRTGACGISNAERNLRPKAAIPGVSSRSSVAGAGTERFAFRCRASLLSRVDASSSVSSGSQDLCSFSNCRPGVQGEEPSCPGASSRALARAPFSELGNPQVFR